MQHRLDLMRHESVTYFPGQAGRRHHPVGGLRHHRKAVLAEVAGEVAREIGGCKVKDRVGFLQLLRLRPLQHQIAQRAGVAL